MAIRKSERAAALQSLSFRITPGLREKLESAASNNGRSLTSEVLSRLEQSFTQGEVIERLTRELMGRVEGSIDDTERDTQALTKRLAAKQSEQVRPVATVDLRALIEETVERTLARTGKGAAVVPGFTAKAAGNHDKRFIAQMNDLRALLHAAVSLVEASAQAEGEPDPAPEDKPEA